MNALASHRLPALAEHRRLRYATLTLLYIAQGLPQGLFVVAIPAFLAEAGLGTAEVGGFIGLALLPWSLKLVAGPVMDRFSFLPMGRRRPWVIGAQLGVVASFAAMAFVPDPVTNLGLLAAMACTVNVFVALQDVAVDGMAVDVLSLDEQARATGFMWGGGVLGVAVSAVGGGALLAGSGVGAAALALAGAIAVIMLLPLGLRERPGERLLPWTEGRPSETAEALQLQSWGEIVRSLWRVFVLPMSLLTAGAVFLFGALDGLVIALMPVLTVQELGWEDTGYSGLVGVAQVVAGLVGMVGGGVLVERLGRVRTMALTTGVLVAAATAMALGAALWPERATIVAWAVVYVVTLTLLTIAYLATSMALCGKAIAATQFALYMAVSNLGRSAGSALLGPLDGRLGYQALFGAVAVCGVLALAFVRFIDLDRHRADLAALDAAEPTVENGRPVAVVAA